MMEDLTDLTLENEQLKKEIKQMRAEMDKMSESMRIMEKQNAEGTSTVRQMTQMFEAMQRSAEKRSTMDTTETATAPDCPPGFTQRLVPVTVHLNKSVQQLDPPEVQWPPYGLPPNYTPPIANDASNQTAKPQGSDAKVVDSQITPPQGSATNVMGVTPTPNAQQVFNSAAPSSQEKGSAAAVLGVTPAYNVQWFPGQQATNFGMPNQSVIFGANTGEGKSVEETQLRLLEERLKVVEGNSYDIGDAADLCLVPDVVIPPKFKMPDFDKYKGTTCPKSHLTMYCRKMASYAHDDKLLIHCFQDSLTGAALGWYVHLERARVRCWKDLADAFLKQYRYNMEVAPDRLQLQAMSKKNDETFKEYAQRWRELAAQVQPPLSDREVVTLFIDTLRAPYYDRMIGSMTSSFSDLVIIGERVENGLKSGKIASDTPATNSSKKPATGPQRKKEGETNAVTYQSFGGPNYRPPHFQQTFHSPLPYPQVTTIAQSPIRPFTPVTPQTPIRPPQQSQPWSQNPNQSRPENTQQRKQIHFDPIPMSYTELLPILIQNSLVVPVPMQPIEPPFPRGYDPNAKCDYHAGATGHSTEACRALKFKVQNLINAGWLNFKENSPNVGKNPLPAHGGPSVNAVEEGERHMRKRVEDVKTPLRIIFKELCKAGLINGNIADDGRCGLHSDTDHTIEDCEELKRMLQGMMDRKLVQIGGGESIDDVSVIDYSASTPPKPLVIHYTRDAAVRTANRPMPITIQVPTSFPYKDDKAVPWRYDVEVLAGGRQVGETNVDTPNVTNIAGVGGMTRSGRIYTPEEFRTTQSNEVIKEKEKGKEVTSQKEITEETRKEIPKQTVSDEEACEFLKLIKQSEYRVIDQLNRTPARISLLSLMMHSEPHRKILLNILKEAHVVHNISTEQFGGIIGNITANNHLTFTEEEMPAGGADHNKALHISVKYRDCFLARVLVDNGSSLNVMPKETLEKLPSNGSQMKPSSMVVRAFDGSRREVIGEISLPLQIGPVTFDVVFQVMDITPAYSCLLGRPWIHSAKAVTSTLHQKLKFIVDNKLIIISAEDDLLISKPSSTPYIEAAEEALETSFQALEIAHATYEKPNAEPQPSEALMMVARVMLENGYQYGRGLGRYEQGVSQMPNFVGKQDKFGLGYKPSSADVKRLVEEKRFARLRGKEPRTGGVPICDIRESFISAGFEYSNLIAAAEEHTLEEVNDNWVRADPSDAKLPNWEIVELPVIFNFK